MIISWEHAMNQEMTSDDSVDILGHSFDWTGWFCKVVILASRYFPNLWMTQQHKFTPKYKFNKVKEKALLRYMFHKDWVHVCFFFFLSLHIKNCIKCLLNAWKGSWMNDEVSSLAVRFALLLCQLGHRISGCTSENL